MRFEIKVDTATLKRVVTFLQFRNFHTSTILSALGAKMQEQHERRVRSEKTSPDGAKWAALCASTVRQKGNSNILVRTGAMASAWVRQQGATSVRMSNGRFYLGFHQNGTRKMVARPVMGFSDANIAELKVIVDRFILAAIGA